MGSAVPGELDQQALWDGFFADHYRGSRVAEAVWRRSGVATRHGVADPTVEDVSQWGTGERMRRFVSEALPLGKEAIGAALDQAGLSPTDIGQLVVVSCTGYATPGLDILLARDLGMPADLQRLHIGHMGCYAALPALATAADTVAARGLPAVVLCAELTSLHVQPARADLDPRAPMRDDVEQMVAHALFSDAASAAVLVPGAGLSVERTVARTDVTRAALMSWDVTDHGFRMGLSSQVPVVLAEHVGPAVAELLDGTGLAVEDVTWAVHPGGPRIVDVVAEALGLTDDQVAVSRAVLRDHGNCSSATVLLILQRLLAGGQLAPGAAVVSLAFGPGLTLMAQLLTVPVSR